ncbi:MAG TPA: hypothetical protein VF144_22290 [Chitinophagaceae bacterium]
MEEYKKNLLKEIDELSNRERLSSAHKKKKLIIWTVRTNLSVILYIIFWKYEWVRWTLILYVPLTLFNLVMILGFNFILDRKISKLRSRIDS